MAHFAKLDKNNIVEQVIVVHNDCAPDEQTGQEFLASIGFEGVWKQTSYNTFRGVHNLGGIAFRKNYAGIGFTYDEIRDAFIPPKPEGNWELDENICSWIKVVVPS
jgi:hypothetical protein